MLGAGPSAALPRDPLVRCHRCDCAGRLLAQAGGPCAPARREAPALPAVQNGATPAKCYSDPQMPAAYIWALALGILAACANIFGGLVLTGHDWDRQYLRYFVAIGAGFMLGTALLEMVPQSWKLNATTTPFLLLSGYLLVHLVEHSFVAHFHFGEETHGGAFLQGHLPWSVLTGLCIHTFFDGVAIGSGFLVSSWLGWVIFIAIFMHKIPEGFTIASVMLAAGRGNRAAVLSAAGIGGASVVGVGVMLLFPMSLAQALPFAAGVTLYVAATDLIPEVNRESGIGMAFCVFIGVGVLALLQFLFHGI